MIEAKLSLTLNSGSAVYTIYDTCLSNFALEGLEQSLFCGRGGKVSRELYSTSYLILHSSVAQLEQGARETELNRT